MNPGHSTPEARARLHAISKETLVLWRNEPMTYRQIATRVGCTEALVKARFAFLKITVPRKKFSPEQVAEMARLVESGVSAEEVARRLDVSTGQYVGVLIAKMRAAETIVRRVKTEKRKCLCCKMEFRSPDVTRVRLCPECKQRDVFRLGNHDLHTRY